MKKYLLLFLLSISAGNFCFGQEIKKMKIAELAKMIDTSSVPMIVNFWATWCLPCIHEIPWFEKTVAAYKSKNVKLVLVSLDFAEDYPKKLAAFAKKNGYSSEIIWLNETDADIFCPKIDKTWQGAIPASILVNNKKHYREFFGQQITEPRLQLEVKKLVE